ncbi:MAG TPA: alpha/beta hydrolase [Rariglobus sp.]
MTQGTNTPATNVLREADAQVGEVRIHYRTGGQGEPLLLIHGWPETSLAWNKVAPDLARHYTLIISDLRGFGGSSRPAGGYDRRTLATDLRGLVHQLGYSRIRIAGHDWGGSVAFAYALNWPDEVERLAVLEAMPKGPWSKPGEEPWFYTLHRDADFAEALTAGRERLYLSWFFRNYSTTPGAIDEAEIDAYLKSFGQPGGMRPGFELVRAIPQDVGDNGAALAANGALAMPVLAIAGERSMNTAVAANLHHAARDVREVVLPGAGHFLPEERPTEVTQLLNDFFGGSRP